MTGLQRSGWKIGRLFQGLSGQADTESAHSAKADAVVVRLIDAPRRRPESSIEQRLISTLGKTGPISIASLVRMVAGELYAEELRHGAGVLDIGLFGNRLFNRDVIQELQAGDGILWKIKEPE